MGFRAVVIGLAVTGVLASSCASAARDAFVEAYNEETAAASYDETCRIERQTLATATDAYAALNGTAPASADDLVPELLREMPDAWVIEPGSDPVFKPAVGGRCDGVEATDNSASIGQVAADAINDGNDAGCATDKRQVEAALEIHFALKGADATSMDDLAEFGVDPELNRWMIELPADGSSTVPTIVPVVGGACDG